MYSQGNIPFNKAKSDSLIELYTEFVKRFPGDTIAPLYLFRAASLSMNAGDGNKAISLLDQFTTGYPDHPKVAVCTFFKGYVYENILKNLDKAKESYLFYIEKYPNDAFVKDAQSALKYLGKTPDQMIREFEAMRKADSIKKADSIANLASKRKKPAGH